MPRLKWLLFLLATHAYATTPPVPQSAVAPLCEAVLTQEKISPHLAKYNAQTLEFEGMTEDGLAAFKKARDILRDRVKLFDEEIRNLGTMHHAGTVARLLKANMLLYGPPGGAKSMFVNWLMKAEIEPAFKLQLHQMITEQAFTGGQDFEAAKLGQFKINTKGSLTDHVVALIDEAEKGNPAALASLLSLLNEREVLAGGQVIKARLETLFATSNANLPEMIDFFQATGQGSTGPALLNRFAIKGFVYNWLSKLDQAVLDNRQQKLRRLKARAKAHPEVLKDEVFLEPQPLDWGSMRELAAAIFEPSDLFMAVNREIIDDMRTQTNRAVRESEERNRNNRQDEPFVYFPSADYTERLRQQIAEVVIQSAFVDFMLSPLANDKNLAHVTKHPIKLDPLSLWRGYLVMTTLGPGTAHLKFDPQAEQKLDIDFDWSIDPSSARDKREELLIKNLRDEQERFRRTFQNHMKELQEHIEISARAGDETSPDAEEPSFEQMLIKAQGK